MAGHSGGAWKVAYADFVTAMMAFFMVMWLVAQSKPMKQAVAKYFRDPTGTGSKLGFKGVMPGGSGLMPGGAPPTHTNKVRGKELFDDDKNGEQIKGKLHARVVVPKTGDAAAIGGLIEFDDAAVEPNRRQNAKLRAIAADVVGKPQLIEIIGHSSSRPVASDAAFKDRLDLTYARCRGIASQLESMKIDRKRLRLVVSDQAGQPGQPGRKFTPERPLDNYVEVYLLDVLVKERQEPSSDSSDEKRRGDAKK
jgi:chemotaxis protein MotB